MKTKPKIYGVLDWISEERIKNEKGEAIEFDKHPFLLDIYDDQAQRLTIMKAAQVGLSTLSILKNHGDAKDLNIDIIYTLPTDNDVKIFVGGKVNRIIANNPTMLADVHDKDSVEVKKVGKSVIYFRGTFTKKAAIMVTADRLVHDEMDSSKLDIIADYEARLQHSKYKQIHTFSHPDIPETGVHNDWLNSDQKHWFVDCPHCKYSQYLSWDIRNEAKMSIDLDKKIFVCKRCREELDNKVRIKGYWKARYPERAWSGYWVSLLIAPWVSAKDIINKYNDPKITPWHFATRILGIPYADGASKLLKQHFLQNITGESYAPEKNKRMVIGIDTGLRIDYALGDEYGLFYHGDSEDYGEVNGFMERWPKAIAIIDAGGDLIGSRKFQERWVGRVYICYLRGTDKKGNELVKWGTKDEHGSVQADRNRMIQLVVDEFRDKRIPVHGTEDEWYEYYLDWNNLSRIKILDSETNEVRAHKWVRRGRDHRALATIFWRVGIMRFSSTGAIVGAQNKPKPNSYMIDADSTVTYDPAKLLGGSMDFGEEEVDWRL